MCVSPTGKRRLEYTCRVAEGSFTTAQQLHLACLWTCLGQGQREMAALHRKQVAKAEADRHEDEYHEELLEPWRANSKSNVVHAGIRE